VAKLVIQMYLIKIVEVKMDKNKELLNKKLVGLAVARFRKGLGLTQADLARLLGVSYALIKGFEAGTRSIGVYQLVQLSTILHAPIGDLFIGCFGWVEGDIQQITFKVKDADKRIEKCLKYNKLPFDKSDAYSLGSRMIMNYYLQREMIELKELKTYALDPSIINREGIIQFLADIAIYDDAEVKRANAEAKLKCKCTCKCYKGKSVS
jgi:transcriptional regulator with XRE-family HTH domain